MLLAPIPRDVRLNDIKVFIFVFSLHKWLFVAQIRLSEEYLNHMRIFNDLWPYMARLELQDVRFVRDW